MNAPRVTAPTMSDVARRAGVSTMTVSRALRNGASIARETRERIMLAVEELGYVLDQSAGSLSSKRTGFVAALVPSLNNSNFADTARGLTDALQGSGLQLLLGYTDYSVEKEEGLIESMLRRRPEAIVVTGGSHTPRGRKLLENCGIPVIETWDMPKSPVHHVVGFSNAEASATLVRHLHGRGYKRIAFIGGTTNRDTRGAARREGYEMAMRQLGLAENRVISFGTPPIDSEDSSTSTSSGYVNSMGEWIDILEKSESEFHYRLKNVGDILCFLRAKIGTATVDGKDSCYSLAQAYLEKAQTTIEESFKTPRAE